jgi:uncharacterized protein
VAFSGGVDSSLVAAVAAKVLGDRALAVTAVSPALAAGELDGARGVAAAVGIAHRSITTDELARPGYRRNAPDRCYHCKSELYDRLSGLAETEGYAEVFSGANVDDLGDWRPGLRADKPAMPCLASRIPYGTEVDPAVLAQIDRAEGAIRSLGYGELRVRHLGSTGRVELGDRDLAIATSPRRRRAIERVIVDAGYDRAEIDPEPLRSGSFTGIRTIPLTRTP